MAKPRDNTTARDDERTASATGAHPGSERERDERRGDAGAQVGGGAWRDADRAVEERADEALGDDEAPEADPELAAAEANGEIESGGQRAGMGRGEKPRKLKSEEK